MATNTNLTVGVESVSELEIDGITSGSIGEHLYTDQQASKKSNAGVALNAVYDRTSTGGTATQLCEEVATICYVDNLLRDSALDDLNNDQFNSSSIVSSPISIDIDMLPVFVKLLLMPLGHVFTCTAWPRTTISELKSRVAEDLRVPPDVLVFSENTINIPTSHTYKRVLDDSALLSLFVTRKGIVELEVFSNDHEFVLSVPDDRNLIPVDILTVTVIDSNKTTKEIVVEIESKIERKFLGGFRCTKTNKEYFHAETQTCALHFRHQRANNTIKRSRSCQTNECADMILQTTVHQETQTFHEHITVYSPVPTLRMRADSKSPLSEEEFIETIALRELTSKVIVIQRAWRNWKARQSATKINEESEMESPASSRLPRRAYNNPMVFEVLYQLVERWRRKCLAYAYATKTEGPTRADFQDILEMQVNLLAIIEKERIKFKDRMQKAKEKRMLEQICSPLTWKGYNGLTISMETIHNQRAFELKKLYDVLSKEDISTDQRRENLSIVQNALKSHKDKTCDEILTLISRELQLLEMGFGFKEIESLHKRIEKLFTYYIHGAKSSSTRKTPPASSFYLCVRCKKLQPPSAFVIPLTEPAVKLCASCHWMDNLSHHRVDHTPYILILRELRASEMKRACYKSLAFIMQVNDIRYLIEHIWHSQSIISQISNLEELRLGRWDMQIEWSPWNTILLTKTELLDHSQINELHRVYGDTFIRNINTKLLLAKMHFKNLLKTWRNYS